MRLFLAVAAAVPIGLTSCALAGDARAQERAAVADVLVVRHGVASGCPGGAALAARIDAIAGRPATAGPEAADTRLSVTFAPRSGGGLGATLEATGARSGQRTFEDADVDCAPLAEAVVVAAALLLDAGWNAPPAPLPPVPANGAQTPPNPPTAPPTPPVPPTPPPPRAPTKDATRPDSADAAGAPFFSLGAPAWAFDGWVSYSSVLDTAGGPALALMARRRFGPASVGAGGTFVFPRTDVQTRTSGAVSAWAMGLALEGCLDVSAKPIDATLSPCATGSLRAVFASGDYAENGDGRQPMVGLGGALVFARRLIGPLGLVIRGGAEGHVVRPSFIVEQLGGAAGTEVGEAYEPPVLGVDVGGGVRIELP